VFRTIVAKIGVTGQASGPAGRDNPAWRISEMVFVDADKNAPVFLPGACVLAPEVVSRGTFLLGTGAQKHPDGGRHVVYEVSGRLSGFSVTMVRPVVK